LIFDIVRVLHAVLVSEEIMRRNRREQKELIPFEKSKRVIRLEKRGKSEMRTSVKKILSGFLGMVGVLCLLYCAGVFCVGFGTYFFLIWGVLGLICLMLSWILQHSQWLDRVPKWLKCSFGGMVCLCIVFFCVVEGMILAQFTAAPAVGADYCIVLGAQWKENGPSDVLRRRLDAATEYLLENPETKVIVTGGRGSNEVVAEGVGMRGYLIDAGIEESRIVVENKATNTYENLVFSAEYLSKSEDAVVVVTNNFHVFRAIKIAQKQGYENISGLAADSIAGLLPNNLLREFCGVVKDFVVGNL